MAESRYKTWYKEVKIRNDAKGPEKGTMGLRNVIYDA